MKLSRVGVDLAKNVNQLHGVDRSDKTMLKRRLKRRHSHLGDISPEAFEQASKCAGAVSV